MEEIDKKILNIMQKDFPLDQKPFARVGELIGLEEKDVIERVANLKKNGYIRRIGPIFERKKLEYASTLCGVHLDKDRMMEFINEINTHAGVTHNYERQGYLNVWFTIAARTKDDINIFLSGLEAKHALKIYRFPEKKVFKIKTFFPL